MPITSARTGFHLAAPVATLVVLTSCAFETNTKSAPAPVSSAVLSETQISAVLPSTAYDAIEHLRPLALNVGGAKSREPTVYLDGMELGGVAELQRISAAGIGEIRFLNSLEASARFGPTHRSGGAIVLTSKIWRSASVP
jgi:hypothetical protein